MKLTLILAALALPATAQAQSLTDTHELTWRPAGKTPAATYRPLTKSACTKRLDDYRAGKGQYRAAKACPTVAKKPVAATTAN